MNELEIISHSRIQGLTVFFNTVDYRTPHFHPEWELLWLLDHPLTVSRDGSSFTAQPGEVLLLLPNQPHELRRVGENSTFLCLQVSPELLGLTRQPVTDSTRLAEHLTEPEMVQVRQQLASIMAAYLNRGEFDSLSCLGQVLLLFHLLLTRLPVRTITREEQLSTEKRNKRLTSLIRFVDENYMHKIRLSDFAEAEGFSMSYLSHFIKTTLNQTFQEYVNSVRVNCACKLMAESGRKLTEISLEAGFSDYRYFSGAFRRQFGVTPEQYRQSLVKPENAVIHHSIHSLERFYTDEQSRRMLEQICVE